MEIRDILDRSHYMWPSYLINLADNVERFARSQAQFRAAGIPFARIDGVNGWRLTEDEIQRVYDARRATRPLVPPEIGCYLSHVAAWETVAAADPPGGFIFEDDFLAGPSLAAVLEELSVDSGPWDIVKLFTLRPEARWLAQRPMGREHRLVTPFRVPTCLLGYAIRKETAARLAQQSVPFFRPVDEDQKFYWEKSLRVGLVLPAPLVVGDQQTQTGTIGDARRAARKGKTPDLAKLARGIRYQTHYKTALWFHRLLDRLRGGFEC